jgi:opacity protein-like surface antigen
MVSATRNVVLACLGVAALFAAVGARAENYAQESPYFELGITQLNYTEPGYSVRPTNALVRAGYDFNPNFSIEGLVSESVSSDTLQGISFKVDSGYGAYLKGNLKIAPRFEVFGLAGWAHATVSASIPGASLSASGNSFSYGVGAQYRLTRNFYGRMDYVSYYNKNLSTVKGPSISVGFRF